MKSLKQIPWRQWYYHIKHRYFTVKNAVIAIAFMVAISWAWGSVSMMQRNYTLQRKLDTRERQLELSQLEVRTLELQKRYYQSSEYQELAARQELGLALPGEKLLILPPNSEAAQQSDDEARIVSAEVPMQPSNLEQWMNFLLGRNAGDLPETE